MFKKVIFTVLLVLVMPARQRWPTTPGSKSEMDSCSCFGGIMEERSTPMIRH